MCINQYAAHPLCRHPNQVTAPGEDWTQYTEIIPCRTSLLALRHARGRPEEVYCSVVPWVAVIDYGLSPFCAGCEHGTDNRTVNSATFMYSDFETKKNQWEYRGRLSEEETQAIQDDIDDLLNQHDDETLRGPYNNSYWVLRRLLDEYTVRWEGYVNRKLENDRQRAQQRQEDEMYRQALQGGSESSATEEDDFAVEFEEEEEEEEEASSSQSHSSSQPGPSSHSRHHGQQHSSSSKSSGKQSRTGMWTQFFGGKRRKR